MTVEERLERIEHITAGFAEERRKDREEYKQLWRDTQKQIEQLTQQVAETNAAVKEVDQRLGKRIEELSEGVDRFAQESRAADQRLGDRIESLVSAMGKFFQERQGPL